MHQPTLHLQGQIMTPIVLLGEAWGENEDRVKQAFVGASGIELMKMLDQAGIINLTPTSHEYIGKFWRTGDPNYTNAAWELHPQVYRTNVFNTRPEGNKIEALCTTKEWGIKGFPALAPARYLRPEHEHHLERLAHELDSVNPNLVIAMGNTTTWALLKQTGITSIRGTTVLSSATISGFKVLPTFHPAAVLRQWELRPTVVLDLRKAKRESAFPEIRRPERRIFIPETVDDLYLFEREHIGSARRLSVDIETSGNQITCIGFAPDSGVALVIPIYHRQRIGRSYWKSLEDEVAVWRFIRSILNGATPKTFQNGLYDIAFLWRAYKIPVVNAEEDTMLLHHAMQPESLKGLGYLGSVYTDEGNWKRMRNVKTIKQDD